MNEDLKHLLDKDEYRRFVQAFGGMELYIAKKGDDRLSWVIPAKADALSAYCGGDTLYVAKEHSTQARHRHQDFIATYLYLLDTGLSKQDATAKACAMFGFSMTWGYVLKRKYKNDINQQLKQKQLSFDF